MPQIYPIEWFDLIITETLNPSKADTTAITVAEANLIKLKVTEERDKVQLSLMAQIFGLTKASRIQQVVRQYYKVLVILLDRAHDNEKKLVKPPTQVRDLYRQITNCVDDMVAFIEERCRTYLSNDERVPVTWLGAAMEEFRRTIEELSDTLAVSHEEKLMADTVLNSLREFTKRPDKALPISFRDILYKKELLSKLQSLRLDNNQRLYSALEETLIYMNFNSKSCMKLFTQLLAEKINTKDGLPEKIEQLLLYQKEFNQIQRKQGVALNHGYSDLSTIIGNWFTQELSYLRRKLRLSVLPLKDNPAKNSVAEKVSSILTVDQMALVLRAADDLRILIARSLSSVFRLIVPHLSTPHQKDISYDSMRSKSYSAEKKDKEVAINTLAMLIEKIKTY
jgi:hypothetical protein